MKRGTIGVEVFPMPRRKRHQPGTAWIESRTLPSGSKSYRIRWLDPATGQRGSEACDDMATAKARRSDKTNELRYGRGRSLRKRISELRDQLPEFMTGRAANTVAKTQASLDELIAAIGDLFLNRIDRARLMEFRAARAELVRTATVNRDLRQISSALGYAVDAGWLGQHPMLGWKKRFLREPEKIVRVVEPAELEQLLAACDQVELRGRDVASLQVCLKLAYYQGLRRFELVKLRWEDISLENAAIRVVNVLGEVDELTKSRRNRTAPLRQASIEALTGQWERAAKIVKGGQVISKHGCVFVDHRGQHWEADWLTHVFAKLVEKAGIPACTLHDLRRSWSTLLQRAGVDRSVVKDLGGWSSISVVERHYTGEVDQAYRRAIEKVDRQAGSA